MWLPEDRHGRRNEHKETFQVIDIFIILIAILVSELYTYVKTYQIM